jgi:hypothetical protein
MGAAFKVSSRRLVVGLLVLVAAACSGETALDPADAGFTHVYYLDGSLGDAQGGPDLVATGGDLGADGFRFEPGDGLTAPIDLGSDYTIEMRVRIDEYDHAAKLLDFSDRATDGGLYIFEPAMVLFWFSEGCAGRVDDPQGCSAGYTRHPLGGTRDAVTPGEWLTIRFSRDGGTGMLSAELDGVAQTWQVEYPPFAQPEVLPDPVARAADFLGEATQADPILHFLLDDRRTNSESGRGELDYIKIAVR